MTSLQHIVMIMYGLGFDKLLYYKCKRDEDNNPRSPKMTLPRGKGRYWGLKYQYS